MRQGLRERQGDEGDQRRRQQAGLERPELRLLMAVLLLVLGVNLVGQGIAAA